VSANRERMDASSQPLSAATARSRRRFDRRLIVDDGSAVPLYLQLADQLKYLIATGELPVGSRLPSVRHLSQNLNINRNTVLMTYAALAREGFAHGRRGAGTVVTLPANGRDSESSITPQLLGYIDQVIEEAQRAGLEPDELAALVASHARLRTPPAIPTQLRICFVECNPQSLEHYVPEIEKCDVQVEGVLLDDLSSWARSAVAKDVDAIVSTFFHLSDVRRHLIGAGLETELFAVGVRPHLSMIDALENLREGAVVGVVYYAASGDAYAEDRLRRMADAVEHTGVRGLRVRPLLLTPASPDTLMERDLLAELDAVVIRPENIAPMRHLIPKQVTTIDFVNELDSASRRFLTEVFEDIRAKTAELTSDEALGFR
jgi:GntR family transcriptional regulator